MNGHCLSMRRHCRGKPMSGSSRQKIQGTAAQAATKTEHEPKTKSSGRTSKESKLRVKQLEKRVSSGTQQDLLLSNTLRRLALTNAAQGRPTTPVQLTGRARRILERARDLLAT